MGKHKKIKDMEPDDVIEEDPETYVGSPDDVLIDHTFERSLENAFAEKAVVVLTLDRKTGRLELDTSMSSTPMETFAILYHALEQHDKSRIQPLYDGFDDD